MGGLVPDVSHKTRSEFLVIRAPDVDFNERRENYYFGRGLICTWFFFSSGQRPASLRFPRFLPVLLVLLALVAAVKGGSGAYALLFAFLFAQMAGPLVLSVARLEGLYLGTAATAAVLYRGTWMWSRFDAP